MKVAKIHYIKSNYLPIFRGIALPWVGVIIKETYKDDINLIKHELVHLRQIRRMGLLLYLIRYFVQLVFIGYEGMPLEVEARQHDTSLWNYRKRHWRKKWN